MMPLRRALGALGASKYLTPAGRATIGSVASAFGGQLLLVLSGIALARLLGPSDRGYVALLTLWPVIVFQIVGIGLPAAVAYHIAGRLVDTGRLVRLLAAPFAIQCGVLLLAHSFILLAYLREKPATVAMAGAISLAIGPALLVWDYALAVLQGLKRYASLNLLRYLPSALIAGAALAMLVARRRSVAELVSLITMAYITCAILAIATAGRGLTTSPSSRVALPLRTLVGFGLRGYLGSLYPLDAFRLDLVLVGLLLNPFSVGLYVVASSVTNVPRFVALGVVLVALPHIASTPDHQSRRSLILRFALFAGAVSLAAVLVLETVVGNLIPIFFGESFHGSIVVAQIMLVGVLFLAIRRVLAESLKGAGFPLAGTVSEAASWLALIPALGIMMRGGLTGIAWALSFAFAFSLLVLVIIAVMWDKRRQSAVANLA